MTYWIKGLSKVLLWPPTALLFVLYLIFIKAPYLFGGGSYELLDFEKILFWAVLPKDELDENH